MLRSDLPSQVFIRRKAPLEGWHYGTKEIVKKFHIYHRVAIEYSGGIYDIDNLRRAHLICMMKFITGDS
ncbi:hypothetical protein ACFH3U_003381 [Escherichia coli]